MNHRIGSHLYGSSSVLDEFAILAACNIHKSKLIAYDVIRFDSSFFPEERSFMYIPVQNVRIASDKSSRLNEQYIPPFLPISHAGNEHVSKYLEESQSDQFFNLQVA